MVTVSSYISPIANIPRPIILSETVNNTLNASLPENNGFTFEWTDTDGGVYPLGTSLFREYQGPDTIFYIVTVTNPNNNCTNADTIEVRSISDNTLLYVPNVFSPNATNTENQKLRLFGDNLFGENFNIQIYNKWGNLVYETTDLSEIQTNGWDGGSKVVGTYVYILSGTFKNGKDVKESPFFKGTFNLIE